MTTDEPRIDANAWRGEAASVTTTAEQGRAPLGGVLVEAAGRGVVVRDAISRAELFRLSWRPTNAQIAELAGLVANAFLDGERYGRSIERMVTRGVHPADSRGHDGWGWGP